MLRACYLYPTWFVPCPAVPSSFRTGLLHPVPSHVLLSRFPFHLVLVFHSVPCHSCPQPVVYRRPRARGWCVKVRVFPRAVIMIEQRIMQADMSHKGYKETIRTGKVAPLIPITNIHPTHQQTLLHSISYRAVSVRNLLYRPRARGWCVKVRAIPRAVIKAKP